MKPMLEATEKLVSELIVQPQAASVMLVARICPDAEAKPMLVAIFIEVELMLEFLAYTVTLVAVIGNPPIVAKPVLEAVR